MFSFKSKEKGKEKLNMKISVMDLPEHSEKLTALECKIDTLIQLIASHRDSLPKDLMRSIKRLAKDEHCEFDSVYFNGQGLNRSKLEIIADGAPINLNEHKIESVNPILRRLKCIEKGDIYAKTLVIKDDKKTYMEW